MNSKAGFTLIEALVALAIGAGVMAMAAQGFGLSVAGIQRAETRQSQADAILAAHAVLRAKIAKIVIAPTLPITGVSDGFSFTLAESGETAPAGLYEARLTIEAHAAGWALWLTRTPVGNAGASVRETIWQGAARPRFAFDGAESFAGAEPPRIVSLAFDGSGWPALSIAPANSARRDAPPPPDLTTTPLRDPAMEVPQ
jgi:prepilin-type N-terminal cleavage/methylation domain-containing protein